MSHVEAVTAAHDRSWNEIMESIVKHGSEKRSLEPITCGKDKTLPTLWREEGLDQLSPPEHVEVEEGKGGQAMHRKAMEQEEEEKEEEGEGGVYSQCWVAGNAARGAEEEGKGAGGRNARCR